MNQKSKMAAGLLGIFLGAWGIHNFYLGFNKKAIIQIVVSLVTCGIGGIWGFIEGIMILCGKIKTAEFSAVFYFYSILFQSASLNPTKTLSPLINSGRFTSIPSVANNCSCSSSVISGSFSFRAIDL